jgi:hypothetical protein
MPTNTTPHHTPSSTLRWLIGALVLVAIVGVIVVFAISGGGGGGGGY